MANAIIGVGFDNWVQNQIVKRQKVNRRTSNKTINELNQEILKKSKILQEVERKFNDLKKNAPERRREFELAKQAFNSLDEKEYKKNIETVVYS